MAEQYDGNNAAFIKGQGEVGHKWSNPKLPNGVHAAAMRYSELGFAPLAKELFGGIKENAVDFIPNFDETEKEPVMLPVSFPSLLVNNNKGIAVSLGSCMPSYEIKNVCDATAGILSGKYKTDEEVVKALGVPDFPCECRVHYDDALLMKLYKTGKASFKCSGTYHVSGAEIIVDSCPPSTTFEAIIKQIKAYALTPEGKNIEDITSNVGRGTKGIRIKVKRSTNVQELMKCLYAKTSLLDSFSFYTQIIWKGQPEELSVKKVLNYWLSFRDDCLVRIYKHRHAVKCEQEHKLETWVKIKDDLKAVVNILSTMTEEQAVVKLKEQYGLDDIQCEYLMGMQVRSICTDKAQKSLEKYEEVHAELLEIKKFLTDKTVRAQFIIDDLTRIGKTYGTPRKTAIDGLVQMELVNKKREIPDTLSTVFITKKGFIKAIDGAQGANDADRFLAAGDEILIGPLYAKKNEHLLIYTYSGICYKLLVDVIESSKGNFKQYVWELVTDRADNSDIFYVTRSGNYNEKFAVIYGSGRGRLVETSAVSGRMKRYKNQFPAGVAELGHQDSIMLLPYDTFVLVTIRGKAAMGSLETMKKFNSTGAFKVTCITDDDMLIKVLDAKNWKAYQEKGYINTDKYLKGYPIKYGNDPITYLDKPVEEFEVAWNAYLKRVEEAKNANAASNAEQKA